MMNFKGKLNVKAVIIGLVVDTVGSFLLIFVVGFIWGVVLAASGLPQVEIAAKAQSSFVIMLIALVGCLLFTVVGGYIAAHIAEGSEMLNSLVLGFVEILLGIVTALVLSKSNTSPFWYSALAILLTVPCALAGGYLRLNSRPKPAAQAMKAPPQQPGSAPPSMYKK